MSPGRMSCHVAGSDELLGRFRPRLISSAASRSSPSDGLARVPSSRDLEVTVVAVVQRQNVHVGVRHVETRGEHPDLLRSAGGLDRGGHSPNHQHRFDERLLVRVVNGRDVASGDDEGVADVDRVLIEKNDGTRVFINDKSARGPFRDGAKYTVLVTHDVLYIIRGKPARRRPMSGVRRPRAGVAR